MQWRPGPDDGANFAAVVGRDNMIGTQFHPEKSQTAGLRLLGNFLQWNGEKYLMADVKNRD